MESRVGGGQGIEWIRQGWELFRRDPGIWIAITVIYLVLAVVANLIPIVGSLAMALVAPVLVVGVMQGARDQLAGLPLKVGHLFAGFSHPRVGSLVLLGFITMLAALAIGVVGTLALAGAAYGGATIGAQSLGAGVMFGLLIMLAAGLLLAAAMWFAPPLVAFRGMEPVPAVLLSFRSCLVNFLPMLVWSAIALVLLVLGALPAGLGLLVVTPILFAGYYLMYRDIFGE